MPPFPWKGSGNNNMRKIWQRTPLLSSARVVHRVQMIVICQHTNGKFTFSMTLARQFYFIRSGDAIGPTKHSPHSWIPARSQLHGNAHPDRHHAHSLLHKLLAHVWHHLQLQQINVTLMTRGWRRQNHVMTSSTVKLLKYRQIRLTAYRIIA